MAVKVIVHLDSQVEPEVGNSEVYYLPDSSATIDNLIGGIQAAPLQIAGANFAVQNLLTLRTLILAPRWSITAVECVEEGGNRQGRYTTVDVSNWAGAYLEPGVAIQKPVESFASLLVQSVAIIGGKRYVAQRWMSGCAETIIDPRQSNSLNLNGSAFFAANTGAFALWQAGMVNLGFCNKTRKTVNPASYTDLTGYLVNLDGRTAVATPLLSGMATGNVGFVNLKGIKAPRGHNGLHRFTVPNVPSPVGGFAAGTYWQVGPFRRTKVSVPLWTTSPGGSGVVMTESVGTAPVAFTYQPITFFAPLRVSEHKRGRPFKQPAGRRS